MGHAHSLNALPPGSVATAVASVYVAEWSWCRCPLRSRVCWCTVSGQCSMTVTAAWRPECDPAPSGSILLILGATVASLCSSPKTMLLDLAMGSASGARSLSKPPWMP